MITNINNRIIGLLDFITKDELNEFLNFNINFVNKLSYEKEYYYEPYENAIYYTTDDYKLYLKQSPNDLIPEVGSAWDGENEEEIIDKGIMESKFIKDHKNSIIRIENTNRDPIETYNYLFEKENYDSMEDFFTVGRLTGNDDINSIKVENNKVIFYKSTVPFNYSEMGSGFINLCNIYPLVHCYNHKFKTLIINNQYGIYHKILEEKLIQGFFENINNTSILMVK